MVTGKSEFYQGKLLEKSRNLSALAVDNIIFFYTKVFIVV
jgi:hypothetical protein